MIDVDTRGYKDALAACHAVKSPLYVYGGPGIGKSEIPRQYFKEVAKQDGKKFHEWTDLTLDQKMHAINNPDEYFIFCDQRVGQMDTTDLRGIPNLVNTEMLETIPMSWVIYFCKPDAHGVIFFDELNLAAPVVAGQAYQIINDRAIADRRLGNDVWVFGAGNRAGIDQAHVFEMPFPLRDRFNEICIHPCRDEWVKWAAGNVNAHLIAFVSWKESYLYKVVEDSVNKSSTPRGIVRASKLIGNNDILSDDVHTLISMAVGEGFATEFQAYCKHFQDLDFKKIYKNPEMVQGMKSDKLWAIIGGMTEQFLKGADKEKFQAMMYVVDNLEADFAIVALRMMKDTDQKKFSKQVKVVKNIISLADKYGEFIMAG